MDKKKKTRSYFDPPPAQNGRFCDHPGCGGHGEFKAPKARNRLNDYFWFCLDHVREYNLQWDYYKGLKDIEIESMRRRDTVWDRPSWPFGSKAQYKKFRASFDRKWAEFSQNFGIFEEDNQNSSYSSSTSTSPGTMDYQTVRALNTLGLTPPMDFESIKRHYKGLVKKFHPDLHGGDKDAEERFKSINEAFQTVKRAFDSI